MQMKFNYTCFKPFGVSGLWSNEIILNETTSLHYSTTPSFQELKVAI
jgi:hypothetical protein